MIAQVSPARGRLSQWTLRMNTARSWGFTIASISQQRSNFSIYSSVRNVAVTDHAKRSRLVSSDLPMKIHTCPTSSSNFCTTLWSIESKLLKHGETWLPTPMTCSATDDMHTSYGSYALCLQHSNLRRPVTTIGVVCLPRDRDADVPPVLPRINTCSREQLAGKTVCWSWWSSSC